MNRTKRTFVMEKKQNKAVVLMLGAVIFTAVLVFHDAWGMSYSLDSIIKTPTLDDCVKSMGMTEEECREVFSEFSSGTGSTIDMDGEGNITENESQGSGEGQQGDDTTQNKLQKGVAGGTSISSAKSRKERLEQNFAKIERRIEALVDFFKRVGSDIEPLRDDLSVFREKQQEILDQQDLLIEEFSKSSSDSSGVDVESVEDYQRSIELKTEELTDFYWNTMRKSTADLISEL